MNKKLKTPHPKEDEEINLGIQNDPSNPEWTEQDFSRSRPAKEALAKIVGKANATSLLNRSPGRPPKENPRKRITIRLDADLVEWIKEQGPGYQTRINTILRNAMEHQ